MQLDDYIEQSARTLSPEFHEIPEWKIFAVLDQVRQIAKMADGLKKQLYYGKGSYQIEQLSTIYATKDRKAVEIPVDILHAALGLVTEAGEIVELVMGQMRTGLQDITHLREESGDLVWYWALLMRAMSADGGEILQENIDKLRKRYPHRFTLEDALARKDEAA